MSASLSYSGAGLFANGAYYTAADPTSGKTVAIGKTAAIGYTFGSLTTRADWVNYLNPSSTAALSNVNVFGLGGTYAFTPAMSADGAVYYATNRGASENKSIMFAFGGQYFLSKRTTLYAQVGVAHNKGVFQTNLAVLAPDSFAVPTGATTTAVNVGIRHTF